MTEPVRFVVDCNLIQHGRVKAGTEMWLDDDSAALYIAAGIARSIELPTGPFDDIEARG